LNQPFKCYLTPITASFRRIRDPKTLASLSRQPKSIEFAS
jgi:hypothetical protein